MTGVLMGEIGKQTCTQGRSYEDSYLQDMERGLIKKKKKYQSLDLRFPASRTMRK